MSTFVPNKSHLREALLFCFHLKKSARESHRMLEEAYGEHALSYRTCVEWFDRFKNGDFGTKDKKRPGQPKKFHDAELKSLLEEDPNQSIDELANTLNVDRTTVARRLKTLGLRKE